MLLQKFSQDEGKHSNSLKGQHTQLERAYHQGNHDTISGGTSFLGLGAQAVIRKYCCFCSGSFPYIAAARSGSDSF